MEMRNFEGAVKYYDKRIELEPNNDELYFWRGRSYREWALVIKRQNNHQNTDESMGYFQKSNDDYYKALELSGEQTELI